MKHEHPAFRSLVPRFLSHGLPGTICGLIILYSSLGCAADQEPLYSGRLLSEWLGDMCLGEVLNGASPTEKAVQALGTNAISPLLKWMSYEPSPAELSRETEENMVHWRPVTNLNRYPAQRGERAGYAFRCLGAVARSAIPELTRLARTASNQERADRLAFALASIGKEALPSLVSLATNAPSWTRYSAIGALVSFADDTAAATPLVPMLINWLSENDTNTDYPVDGQALKVLVAFGPGVAVPALTNALLSGSALTRARAIGCLLLFEYQNPTNVTSAAVPVLRAAMRDPDAEVRSLATRILRDMGGWERVGAEWVRRRGTNTLNGITPDFFTNGPPR